MMLKLESKSKIFRKIMKDLYGWLIGVNKKQIVGIIVVETIIGLILSTINDKYEHFCLLQCLVSTVLFIEVIVLKIYKKKINELNCYFNPNSITGCNYAQLKKDNCSVKIKIIACVFGLVSNMFFLILHLIPINGLGMYIIILLYVTLYFSMIGYVQVILFIKFLIQFDVNDIDLKNKLYPRNNKLLKKINEIINLQAITFAILGMIYTLIYSIVAPEPVSAVSSLLQDYKGKSLNINHIILFYTWLQILVLIVTAFFVILLLAKKVYNNILIEFNDRFQIEIWSELNTDKQNFSALEYFSAVNCVYEIVDKMERTKKSKTGDRQIYVISLLFHLISFTILISDWMVALENIAKRIIAIFCLNP